jgi:hypothetical protein
MRGRPLRGGFVYFGPPCPLADSGNRGRIERLARRTGGCPETAQLGHNGQIVSVWPVTRPLRLGISKRLATRQEQTGVDASPHSSRATFGFSVFDNDNAR